jgi:uncharacterized OsmC-like protein
LTNDAEPPVKPIGLLGEVDAPLAGHLREQASATRTLRCRTESTGRFRQRHHVRNLPPFGDGPDVSADPLGDDTKPSPPEALLAALGSCLAIVIHAGALARSMPIRRLQIELSANLEVSALWGNADPAAKSARIDAIKIIVHVDTDAPREALNGLLDHAVLRSPMGNTLHNPVHLDIALAD